MILEYMFFSDDTSKENVEEYNQERIVSNYNVHITNVDVEAKNYWAIRYEIKGDNRDNAKVLSEINDAIINKFHPTTLVNESAEYYNKILYPLINNFERLLRKYLYIKTAICDDSKVHGLIKDLENKDFGVLSRILFVDEIFCKTAREGISKATSREDMIALLEQLDERTTWDIMVEKGTLSAIQENFNILKEYRNDVMHAHNINYERYRKIRKLFDDVNVELSKEIEKTLRFPDSPESAEELTEALHNNLFVSLYAPLIEGDASKSRLTRCKLFDDGTLAYPEISEKDIVFCGAPDAASLRINPEVIKTIDALSSLEIKPEVVDTISKIASIRIKPEHIKIDTLSTTPTIQIKSESIDIMNDCQNSKTRPNVKKDKSEGKRKDENE